MNSEQLKERRNGIGSSDAPIVMGVSPWTTPRELWQNKVYGKDARADNPSMKRGRDLEEKARQEFEKIVGTLVAPDILIHPEINWMRASLDGIDCSKKVMVELKCPGKEDHALAVGNKVPEKYWPQVQHQLEVAGLDDMYYFSFDGRKGAVVEVRRDQDYIDSLLEKEEKFWDMVLSKTPPELTDRDFICMEGNEEWRILADEYLAIKALQDREESTRGRLKSLSQGRSAKGHGISLQRQICEGAVDYSAIPELKGLDLSMYRKKSFEKMVIRSI